MSFRRLVTLALLASGCASSPPRTDFARYPGAPAAQDRGQSNPRALALADRVLAAAGGASAWDRARELRWTQTSTEGGIVAGVRDHAWDRWNGRHRTRTRRAATCIVRSAISCPANGPSGGDAVLIFDVFGRAEQAYGEEDGAVFPIAAVFHGSGGARAMWNEDTALLWLPFLLHDPGARLAYVGPSYDAGIEYETLRLTFAASDPTRAGLAFQLFIAHDAIARVEVETVATGNVLAYELLDRVTVAGLVVATRRVDVGGDRIIRVTDLSIADHPDDDDFTAPLALRYYPR